MTVTTNTNRVSYAGDATTNPWSLAGIYFLSVADLKVIRRNADGTETPLVYATDYTVTGAGNPAGGTVTPIAVTVVGATYVIYRDPAVTQSFTLVDGSPFPAASGVQAFDRIVMLIQRLFERATRSLKLRETDTDGSGRYDGNGNRITNIADPVNAADAVTMNYFSNTYAGPIAAAVASATASAGAASVSATSAALSFDSFDDRYLGPKATDPTLDNDGNALLLGALYFNSIVGEMRIWNGSAWVAAYIAAAIYLPLAGGTMTGMLNLAADPVSGAQAATKTYVDNVAAGLDVKASCRLSTTANDTLSGLAARDGVTPVAGDRVLVKNQTTTSQNGIYVAAAGTWTRSTDMNTWVNVPGANVWIEEGTLNADNAYVCVSNQGGTIGTTAINWVLFGGSGVYQASNVNLTAESGLTGAADQVSYYTGLGAKALATLNSLGRSLIGAANVAAAMSALSAVSLTATAQVISGGARITPFSIGTVTTGTVTPDPGNGPMQYLTANGAFTLAPGANKGQYTLEILNGASAGTITTSGFTTVKGDAFNTTNAAKFTCSIIVGQNASTLVVVAN